MKILLVGSQHGNELLGEKLYTYITTKRPELQSIVTYIVGNPGAKARGVRYLESDMNRSYVTQPKNYEEHLAHIILKHIKTTEYSVVLDLHTCTVKQAPSIIAATITPQNLPFIEATHIDHVVMMKPSIAAHSLIGKVPQALSIEVNERISKKLLDQLCDDIKRYACAELYDIPRSFYKVTGFIQKDEAVEAANFQPTKKGFTPFLHGEVGYKTTHYSGFKITPIKQPR